MTHRKHLAVLGSTGSIGIQTLEIVRKNPDHFVIEVLTANNQADALIKQAAEFRPNTVVIGNDALYEQVANALDPLDIKVFSGQKSLALIVEMEQIGLVVNALVGYSGLLPTCNALHAGKDVALANKESLVVAGELITELSRKKQANIIPVDSEHSAIFQCLTGESDNKIEKIILTASGGPFRGKSKDFLSNVTKEQALKHPNWDMGAKITIDSATLMNKGLEVIEARWLFDLQASQIDVVVHPQSVIHSMVQFQDSSLKAQMGYPDMRIPIQYALSYPERLYADFPRFDFADFAELTFEKPDMHTFRNLKTAYEALEKGGNMPCVLNAANEVAVDAFLKDRIKFPEIADVIEHTLQKSSFIEKPGSIEDYQNTDQEARVISIDNIKQL